MLAYNRHGTRIPSLTAFFVRPGDGNSLGLPPMLADGIQKGTHVICRTKLLVVVHRSFPVRSEIGDVRYHRAP